MLGTLMPEEELELELMTTTALRAELRALRSVRADCSRLKKELDECEANCFTPNKPPQHQRKALSTPAPTPSTPVPSYAPSVSSAPTSEAWFQLASAVADTTNEEIIVEADVPFPSQSPITVDPDRSVSIVGRSADDGGRVTLGGRSASRFFVVDGGTLHLTHLNLVNGSAPESTSCDEATRDFIKCGGGAIAVFEDGQLIMTSCDIRGRGRRDVMDAYSGGGVYVLAHRTTVFFYNVSFEGLAAALGAAVTAYNRDESVSPAVIFHGCVFLKNYGPEYGVVYIEHRIFPYLYDCVFEQNEGLALASGVVATCQTTMCRGEIVRCHFRGNLVGADAAYSGAVISAEGGAHLDILDCLFENNAGAVGGQGGAVGLASNSQANVINSTFIENVASDGGVIAVRSGGSATLIGCYARGNYADVGSGGFFYVSAATLVMVNSTVTDSYAAWGCGVGNAEEGAVVNLVNSVFTNLRAASAAGFCLVSGSSTSMADCVHRGSECLDYVAYLFVDAAAQLYALRNVFQDHRCSLVGGVCYVRAATAHFDDCDFIDNECMSQNGGTFFLRPGGELVVTNSRIDGSAAAEKGSVAWLDAGSSMRIVGSTIMNISGEAAFAIHDDSGVDFTVKLDTVTVDDSVNIFSNSSVLLQNCDGFSSATVKKAEIATCESTSDFCLPSSCIDATDVTSAGIDCICTVDGGGQVAFPTNCMQSAVLSVPLP